MSLGVRVEEAAAAVADLGHKGVYSYYIYRERLNLGQIQIECHFLHTKIIGGGGTQRKIKRGKCEEGEPWGSPMPKFTVCS